MANDEPPAEASSSHAKMAAVWVGAGSCWIQATKTALQNDPDAARVVQRGKSGTPENSSGLKIAKLRSSIIALSRYASV